MQLVSSWPKNRIHDGNNWLGKVVSNKICSRKQKAGKRKGGSSSNYNCGWCAMMIYRIQVAQRDKNEVQNQVVQNQVIVPSAFRSTVRRNSRKENKLPVGKKGTHPRRLQAFPQSPWGCHAPWSDACQTLCTWMGCWGWDCPGATHGPCAPLEPDSANAVRILSFQKEFQNALASSTQFRKLSLAKSQKEWAPPVTPTVFWKFIECLAFSTAPNNYVF